MHNSIKKIAFGGKHFNFAYRHFSKVVNGKIFEFRALFKIYDLSDDYFQIIKKLVIS